MRIGEMEGFEKEPSGKCRSGVAVAKSFQRKPTNNDFEKNKLCS